MVFKTLLSSGIPGLSVLYLGYELMALIFKRFVKHV